jgi:RNA polymerase sigma-70 factor (ECF subfamily)
MAEDRELEDLARRAAGGDAAALDLLLARIRPAVLRQCGRLLPCWQDAEEACQDALVQVARNIGRYEGRSRFTTWLYAVVANCARQTYRSLKRRAAERASVLSPADVIDPRTTSVIAGSRLDLLDALERLESHRSDLVAPLVLRDLCQLEYGEIAEHLRIPIGAVRSRIHHARQHVRASLQGN